MFETFFYQFGFSIPCSATYFLEVGARVLLKLATRSSCRGNIYQKIETFRLFFKNKNGEVRAKHLIFL